MDSRNLNLEFAKPFGAGVFEGSFEMAGLELNNLLVKNTYEWERPGTDRAYAFRYNSINIGKRVRPLCTEALTFKDIQICDFLFREDKIDIS